MENKTSQRSPSKSHNPSIMGALFFIVFNILLLSIVSWALLEIWYFVEIFLGHNIEITTTKILQRNIDILIRHNSKFENNVLNNFQIIKNQCENWLGGKIGSIAETFINITEITFVRLLVFITFLPFYFLILLVSIIDGLAQRDIRKFQGSRESTFIFHRLKAISNTTYLTLFFIYMATPYDLPIEVYLITMTFLTNIFVNLSIKNFKKYL